MEKIVKYSHAILDFLTEFAKDKPANLPEVESQVVADRDNHHYLLMRVGWNGKEYIHHCSLHFDINDGKVWIQQNWTDLQVADELMNRGVARQDIVLGFEPEFMRPYTDFAAA